MLSCSALSTINLRVLEETLWAISAQYFLQKEEIGITISFNEQHFKKASLKLLPVVHHQQFQLLGVVDKELVETVGKKISGGLVRAYLIKPKEGSKRLISLSFNPSHNVKRTYHNRS